MSALRHHPKKPSFACSALPFPLPFLLSSCASAGQHPTESNVLRGDHRSVFKHGETRNYAYMYDNFENCPFHVCWVQRKNRVMIMSCISPFWCLPSVASPNLRAIHAFLSPGTMLQLLNVLLLVNVPIVDMTWSSSNNVGVSNMIIYDQYPPLVNVPIWYNMIKFRWKNAGCSKIPSPACHELSRQSQEFCQSFHFELSCLPTDACAVTNHAKPGILMKNTPSLNGSNVYKVDYKLPRNHRHQKFCW